MMLHGVGLVKTLTTNNTLTGIPIYETKTKEYACHFAHTPHDRALHAQGLRPKQEAVHNSSAALALTAPPENQLVLNQHRVHTAGVAWPTCNTTNHFCQCTTGFNIAIHWRHIILYCLDQMNLSKTARGPFPTWETEVKMHFGGFAFDKTHAMPSW